MTKKLTREEARKLADSHDLLGHELDTTVGGLRAVAEELEKRARFLRAVADRMDPIVDALWNVED